MNHEKETSYGVSNQMNLVMWWPSVHAQHFSRCLDNMLCRTLVKPLRGIFLDLAGVCKSHNCAMDCYSHMTRQVQNHFLYFHRYFCLFTYWHQMSGKIIPQRCPIPNPSSASHAYYYPQLCIMLPLEKRICLLKQNLTDLNGCTLHGWLLSVCANCTSSCGSSST